MPHCLWGTHGGVGETKPTCEEIKTLQVGKISKRDVQGMMSLQRRGTVGGGRRVKGEPGEPSRPIKLELELNGLF